MSSLAIQAHCNGDLNVIQKKIDLAYGLRDPQVCIYLLITHMFISARCNNFYMFDILSHVKHHKAIFCNGHNIRKKKLDDKMETCDSRISAVFQVTNISSRNDLHPRESEN